MKSIKVTYNIWGNWCGFIGSERVFESAAKFHAVYWLSEKLATNEYKLSPKSAVSLAEVEAQRADLAA